MMSPSRLSFLLLWEVSKTRSSSFLRDRIVFISAVHVLTVVNRSCNKGAWTLCRTRGTRSFSVEKSRLSLLSSARGDPQESAGGHLSGGRAVRATAGAQRREARHSWQKGCSQQGDARPEQDADDAHHVRPAWGCATRQVARAGCFAA